MAFDDTPSEVYVSLVLGNLDGADLLDGYFDGHIVECQLHQDAFDVRDERQIGTSATRQLKTIETRIKKGMDQIRM